MPEELVSSVTVKLDKERRLRYTLRSLKKFKEVTGKDILQGIVLGDLTTEEQAALIWTGLLDEDRELTQEAVDDMVDYQDLKRIFPLLVQALTFSLPEKKGESDPNAESRSTG